MNFFGQINWSFWSGYVRHRGVLRFAYLVYRKIVSWGISWRFAECGSLMLGASAQIGGHKAIFIQKLSAGDRFRMEAISYSRDQRFSPRLQIGNNVSFGNDIHLGCIHRITIGNDVLCGSNITILDHDHGRYSGQPGEVSAPTERPGERALGVAAITIGDNVHVGDYVVILKGVSIGAGSVIGAGAVVTRSVPPNSIAVGNPARVIKRYDATARAWLSVTR